MITILDRETSLPYFYILVEKYLITSESTGFNDIATRLNIKGSLLQYMMSFRLIFSPTVIWLKYQEQCFTDHNLLQLLLLFSCMSYFLAIVYFISMLFIYIGFVGLGPNYLPDVFCPHCH